MRSTSFGFLSIATITLSILAGCCNSCPGVRAEKSGETERAVAAWQPEDSYPLTLEERMIRDRLPFLHPNWRGTAVSVSSTASTTPILIDQMPLIQLMYGAATSPPRVATAAATATEAPGFDPRFVNIPGYKVENGHQTIRGKAMVVADVLTVGLILKGLHDAINDLDRVIKDGGEEVRRAGQSLQINLQTVIDDLDKRLGKHLDYTIDRLEGIERQMFANAMVLLETTRTATLALADHAAESGIAIMHEADIAAYNATTSILCREQKSRFVYASPSVLTSGVPPYDVRIHGNYLQYVDTLGQCQIGSVSAPIQVLNPNEAIVHIPKEVVESVNATTTFTLTAEMGVCHPPLFGTGSCHRAKETQGVSITVKPRLDYTAIVRVSAQAQTSQDLHTVMPYYATDEKCDVDRWVTIPYNFPPLTDILGVSLRETTRGGPSGAGSATCAANSVMVTAHLVGDGYNCLGLNCKGHGWIGYDVSIDYRAWTPTNFPIQESNVTSGQNNFTSPITYSGMVNDETKTRYVQWYYEADVVVHHGTGVKVYHVSESAPEINVDGGGSIKITMNADASGRGSLSMVGVAQ